MKNIPFNISATKQGSRALIRITGTIGWDTNAELFRSQVDGLVAQGAEDVHIYINSPGGSCFDAAEIVNILSSSFKGKVTGEGGAVVASAATFIAVHCDSFEMPENGLFMIHKPWGSTGGTANEIESYLNLLRKIEKQYLDTYRSKAHDPEGVEKQWQAGDWWMSAREALEAGFITSVKAPIQLDNQAQAMIVACGCPQAKVPNNNTQTDNEMDLQVMATALGLPATATQAEIEAAIAAGRQAQNDLAELRAQREREEREARTAEIETLLNAAINDKRITADMRDKWKAALESNFETNKELLASLTSVPKIPIKQPSGALSHAGSATYMGKTFEQLQDENPEALQALMTEDTEAYDSLYEDYLKRNKLK